MARYILNPKITPSKINKEIYGHFSEHLGRCVYEGLYVGEGSPIPNINGMRTDVVEALRQIRIPLLRWPGGCFADEYHWKDGIGPKSARKRMINTHWGGVVEDNRFGTHEFMELCAQLGCEPYIGGNVGSGTVAELQEWVEYMTFDGESPMAALRAQNGRSMPWRVKYFGVGNENWGCGGNMRPEYYADVYRRYKTYVRNYGENKIFKIACGPNTADYKWTEVLMREAGNAMDGLSLHYYTLPTNIWNHKGAALGFGETEYYRTLRNALRMDELITRHAAVMDSYDREKRVALVVDEWGTWYDVEPGTNPGFLYQQNTMRDALVAGLTLNIFNKHSDRVRMANLAQVVNVLQAVILTDGERMLRTPTYHVFDLFKEHQDTRLIETYLETVGMESEGVSMPMLSESASLDEEGTIHITLCNLSLECAAPIEAEVLGGGYRILDGRLLTGGMDAHNTFDNPDAVRSVPFKDAVLTKNGFAAVLPPVSVASITLRP